RARTDRERLVLAEVLGERALEPRGARPGADPARAQRRDDLCDLGLADVGGSEHQHGVTDLRELRCGALRHAWDLGRVAPARSPCGAAECCAPAAAADFDSVAWIGAASPGA